MDILSIITPKERSKSTMSCKWQISSAISASKHIGESRNVSWICCVARVMADFPFLWMMKGRRMRCYQVFTAIDRDSRISARTSCESYESMVLNYATQRREKCWHVNSFESKPDCTSGGYPLRHPFNHTWLAWIYDTWPGDPTSITTKIHALAVLHICILELDVTRWGRLSFGLDVPMWSYRGYVLPDCWWRCFLGNCRLTSVSSQNPHRPGSPSSTKHDHRNGGFHS